jgi:dihydrofolate reductase
LIVSLIVAYDRARGIGKSNGLPWRLPAEMQHFKKTTMGKPIVMGRRTFQSIGRVLPGRRNIVVTRGMPAVDGVESFASLDAALDTCADAPEVMVIGGATIYAAALARADRIYATELDAAFDVDTFFPEVDPAIWRERSRHRREPDNTNPVAMEFVIYERSEAGATPSPGIARQ